jgi:hypothetical protein
MSRKTKSYPLKEFWERKLNIKYNTEIEYYKKFCGGSYKYEILIKDSNLYNKSENITYYNWKRHILMTIENLSIEELREYSRYLNQQYRNYDTRFTLSQTVFAPLILYFVTICLSPLANNLNTFNKVDNLVIYLVFLGGTTTLFINLLIKLLSHKNEQVYKCFYHDIKEIVDEKIELIKSNRAEKK